MNEEIKEIIIGLVLFFTMIFIAYLLFGDKSSNYSGYDICKDKTGLDREYCEQMVDQDQEFYEGGVGHPLW